MQEADIKFRILASGVLEILDKYKRQRYCNMTREQWEGFRRLREITDSGSIRLSSYGKFPLIDRAWEAESFDLTKLLAYFNKNKTTTHSLVPHVGADVFNISHGLIQFPTRGGTMYDVAVSDNEFQHSAFVDFLFRLRNGCSWIHQKIFWVRTGVGELVHSVT
ncbi:hypothetical protein Y032_0784g2338 [Ancylostoma ceylanicum]|nr:hypothetical protein Y032_0784g2338 [Ancylostoma ceylanicum]